jgi:hypothetical protein
MTDQVFVSANFFISERLKRLAEAGIGLGYTRAKRLWEMLIDRQYDSITMQPSPLISDGSGITLPYFMSCLRDHGNLSPEENKMSSYVPEERGQGALCIHGLEARTISAVINVARPDHTDLFSCLWMTPTQPCISPFLPFYIGINKVPNAASGPENPIGVVFEELRLAVERHEEYRAEITDYWKVFELQAISESLGVEREAARLTDEGNKSKARGLLTEFCDDTCDKALAAGRDWVKFLNELPISRKTALDMRDE